MANHIEKVGDWVNARAFTRELKKSMTEELQIALAQIGLDGVREMKKYITEQKGKWKPLNRRYFYRKWLLGLSTNTLVASSTMVQSITSQVNYLTVWIGIKRGKAHPPNEPGGKAGEDVANIAAVMEFGSKKRKIPARPYMQPTLEIMKAKLDDNMLGKRLLKVLEKKYGMQPVGGTIQLPTMPNPQPMVAPSTNPSTIFIGSRGGRFTLGANGRKTYLKK